MKAKKDETFSRNNPDRVQVQQQRNKLFSKNKSLNKVDAVTPRNVIPVNNNNQNVFGDHIDDEMSKSKTAAFEMTDDKNQKAMNAINKALKEENMLQ